MPRLPPGWTPPHQNGVFTAAQAISAGATRAQVRHRLTSGAWTCVAGRALTVRGAPPHPNMHAAAVWLTWPDAVVCRETALLHHLMRLPSELQPSPLHAWVPSPRRAQVRLVPHEFTLPDDDVLHLSGGRITNVVRSAVDTLASLPPHDADTVIAWLVTRKVLTWEDLEARIRCAPGMWGNSQLRRIAKNTATGALSAGERLLHEVLGRARISGWRANVPIRDAAGIIGVADVLVDAARLVIEVDGRAYHGADTFQRDRERRNRLMLAGYVVLHFTWHDLTRRPREVAAQIRQALAQ